MEDLMKFSVNCTVTAEDLPITVDKLKIDIPIEITLKKVITIKVHGSLHISFKGEEGAVTGEIFLDMGKLLELFAKKIIIKKLETEFKEKLELTLKDYGITLRGQIAVNKHVISMTSLSTALDDVVNNKS